MESGTTEWAAMMNRLERLEKQNRRFKQVGALAMIVAGSVLLMGQAPASRTVEANEFILKDAEGRARAKLSSNIYFTGFFLYDENEQLRGSFVLNHEGRPAIAMMAANGSDRARLTLATQRIGEEDIPTFELRGSDEQTKIILNAGTDVWGLALNAGLPDLLFRGLPPPDGAAGFFMGNSGPQLSLYDREGFQTTIGTTDLVTPRTGETHKTSAASAVMFDKDGNVLWQAP